MLKRKWCAKTSINSVHRSRRLNFRPEAWESRRWLEKYLLLLIYRFHPNYETVDYPLVPKSPWTHPIPSFLPFFSRYLLITKHGALQRWIEEDQSNPKTFQEPFIAREVKAHPDTLISPGRYDVPGSPLLMSKRWNKRFPWPREIFPINGGGGGCVRENS